MFCVVPDNIPRPFATVHTSSCQIHLNFRRVLNNDLVLEAVNVYDPLMATILGLDMGTFSS